MRRLILVLLLTLIAVPAFAQTQADVTVSVTLKAADVTALKDALIALASNERTMGRSDIGDIIDGVYTITDANIQAWIKKQVKQATDSVSANYAANLLRSGAANIDALTPEQKKLVAIYIATIKK